MKTSKFTENYGKMCEKASPLQELSEVEDLRARGVEFWYPTLEHLTELIKSSTKRLWSWRFGEGDEDPLSFIYRLNEYSSLLCLKSTTILEEVFLNFYMSQAHHLVWDKSQSEWVSVSNEVKALFNKYSEKK